MINIITFDETTKRFTEYTESEWGEEVEWWRAVSYTHLRAHET